jgi:hypothetical protein
MYGGEVSGNKAASNGGGVYHNGTTFAAGGTAKVRRNTKTADGSANTADVVNGKYIALGTGANAPATGMEIYVRTEAADGVLMLTGAVPGIEVYFAADETGKKVVVNAYGELAIENQ